MSQAYREKLEHIRDAVTHHMYEEEATWFVQLKKELPEFDQLRLTQRYREEFDRYVGPEMPSTESGRSGAMR
jgi:hypothetical protein